MSTLTINTTSTCGLPSPLFLKRGSRTDLNASQSTRLATLPSLSPSGKRFRYSDLKTIPTFIQHQTHKKNKKRSCQLLLMIHIKFLEVTYIAGCLEPRTQ